MKIRIWKIRIMNLRICIIKNLRILIKNIKRSTFYLFCLRKRKLKSLYYDIWPKINMICNF